METHTPDALLLLATGCPHCPTVLQGLGELVKQGLIGRLEAVNISAHPEIAQELGARSVPWTRIGEFQFTGLMSPVELRRWAEAAARTDGMRDYLRELLSSQRLAEAQTLVRHNRSHRAQLAALLADPDTPLVVRLGVDALFEELPAEALAEILPELIELAGNASPTIRVDACHYLGMSHDLTAEATLKHCLEDTQAPVADAAREALETLHAP